MKSCLYTQDDENKTHELAEGDPIIFEIIKYIT